RNAQSLPRRRGRCTRVQQRTICVIGRRSVTLVGHLRDHRGQWGVALLLGVMPSLAGGGVAVDFEPHQIELLRRLVEAERTTAPADRQPFLFTHPLGPPSVQLIHPALPDDTPSVFQGNIETLADEGAVRYTRMAHLTIL